MACLPQSEPLRHCRRFIMNWRPFSSGQVFSNLPLPVADHLWHCIQCACCIDVDNVKFPVQCFVRDSTTVITCIVNNNNLPSLPSRTRWSWHRRTVQHRRPYIPSGCINSDHWLVGPQNKRWYRIIIIIITITNSTRKVLTFNQEI